MSDFSSNPLVRVGDSKADLAPVAVFLASDDSQYVTGEIIHVEGGKHLPRYEQAADAVTSVAGGQWLRFLELESDAPD